MNTVVFDNYVKALNYVIDKIKCRVVDLKVRHIIIVPDHYTLEVERRVYQNSSGALDVDVMTFNRMLGLFATKPSLSNKACVMLIKKLCLKCKFGAFKRSAGFSGFGGRIYDTIQMLKSCNISPSQLRQNEIYQGLKIKLDDIANIYQEYENCLQDKFMDSGDRLLVLRRQILENDTLSNCHCYIANFDYFTPAMTKVIEALDERCKSLTISTLDGVKRRPNLEYLQIYKAVSAVDEIKGIARRIKQDIIKGLRYKDIGVVYKSSPTLLRRIFDEYEIPVNIDIKYDLSTFPLTAWLCTLFEICSEGVARQSMLTLAKNYFANIKQSELIAFCQYVTKYSVDYNEFYQVFDNPMAENARKKLVNAIDLFDNLVYKSANALAFCDNVKSYLLIYNQAVTKLNEKIKSQNADIDAVQVANSIDKILDDISLIVDSSDTVALGIGCLLEALKTKISILPPIHDAVSAGEESLLRGFQRRKIYICEFNEGILPSVTYDFGIITDSEINHLKSKGLNITPSIKDVNSRAKNELFQLLYSGAEIVCSYVLGGDKKPAYLLDAIKNSCKVVEEYTFEDELNYLNELENIKTQSAKLQDKLDYVQQLHFVENSAIELLLSDKIKDHTLNSALFFALQQRGKGVDKYIYRQQDIPICYPDELFFVKKSVSVSRIERYYSCPFWHFLQYGLKLKEVEVGSTAPNDLGAFLHKVLELFVQGGLKMSQLDTIIESTILQKEFFRLRLQSNQLVKDRAVAEIKKVCQIALNQLTNSNFEPFAVEKKFGFDQELKGLELDDIQLSGVIDRIDICDNYVRLIDYKSGAVGFGYRDIYLGKKLQLVAYLKVLQKNGFELAGGFYFPVRDKWDDDQFSHRLVGVYIRQLDLVLSMDKSLCKVKDYFDTNASTKNQSKSKKSEIFDATVQFNKSKGVFIRSNKYAISREDLYKLCDYTQAMLAQSIRQIRQGNISKSPLKDKGLSCQYCPYKPICIASGDKIVPRNVNNTVELKNFVGKTEI